MSDTAKYQVGSYLVDLNEIYIISKIESGRLYYRPAFTDSMRQTVSGSIPLANVGASGYRAPLTTAEVKTFFKVLADTPVGSVPLDPKEFKETIILNNPAKTAVLLRYLWTQKSAPNTVFSGSNNDLLKSILNHFSQEFSLSLKQPPEKIKSKIIAILSK